MNRQKWLMPFVLISILYLTACINKKTENAPEQDESISASMVKNVVLGQQVIKNLRWLNVDQEIDKLTVGNGLTLYAETENIYDGEIVKISIWGKGNETDELVGEYLARVIENKIMFHWILIFEEEKMKNSLHEIKTQRFTKPYYYFSIQYQNLKSHDSKLLSVRAWIRQKFVLGHEPWAYRKYTLILPDDSKVEGWTDAEGNIRPLNDVEVFGKILWYIHKSADEYREGEEKEEGIETPEIWQPDLPPEKPIYYQVKENDNLWKIASYDFIYGNQNLWHTLFNENKHNFIDDTNPHSIETGQTLFIPPLHDEKRNGTR